VSLSLAAWSDAQPSAIKASVSPSRAASTSLARSRPRPRAETVVRLHGEPPQRLATVEPAGQRTAPGSRGSQLHAYVTVPPLVKSLPPSKHSAVGSERSCRLEGACFTVRCRDAWTWASASHRVSGAQRASEGASRRRQ
jgi:hypothetical protein